MEQIAFSKALSQELVPYWQRLRESRIFRTLVSESSVDPALLKLYLIESYHYVKHNAQHQAMVVWRTDVRNRMYMKKMLRHAIEEVDHDQLALNDLEAMGMNREQVERSVPLPQTAGFTGYLYHEVTRGNPLARLGYSLWAEGANVLVHEVVGAIKSKFGISRDHDLSFFVAHAALDERHHEQAMEAIDRFVLTAEDREAVRTIAFTTFELFLGLLEAIYERYLEVKAGAPLLRLPVEPSLRDQAPAWL
jgi:pyrroloquinoline quinone (PQQ) biosynthesis protein C